MKPRFVIFILVFIGMILAIVFWLRPVQKRASVGQSQAMVQSNALPASANVAGRTASNIAPPAPPPVAALKPSPTITSKMRIQDVTEKFVESKNRPIDFYGRVIDQDSNALSGAKIKIGILHLTIPDPLVPELGSKSIQLEQTSDADGRFEFHGETGEGFGVEITKDGYELEPKKYGFGPTAGSYGNPVILKMWRTNIHERLITGNKSFQIVPDGRPYVINLSAGTIVESGIGDLKLWVKRPDPITFGKRYDWACEVDAISGGGLLQEADASASMYQAPTDGYTTSFSYTKDTSANGWGDTTGTQRFYVRLNNGQEYGQISIELEAYHNDQIPGLVRLSYVINPSGSRILR